MSIGLWGLVILVGLLAQFVDVMTGMGFGVIASSLMLATGLPPVVVVATVNLVKVGNGILAGLSHWGFGNVRREWVLPLAIPGVAGALLGATLISHLSEDTVRRWVSVLLLALGGLLFARFLFRAREEGPVLGILSAFDPQAEARHSCGDERPRGRWSLSGIGFLAGLFNAMSGAYGPFLTTLLLLTRGGSPRYIIGTVSCVELFVAGASAIGLLRALGSSGFPSALPIALWAGGLIAAPCGAYLCRHLPARVLEGVVGATVVSLNLWSVLRAFG
jgi:uncharacterized membrane protein YfcA